MTIFRILNNIWMKMTQTVALDRSSGELETAFFESIYRVIYAAGLSTVDNSFPYLMYSSIVKLMMILLLIGEIWFVHSETFSLDDIASCINVLGIRMIAVYKFKNMLDHRDVYKRVATSMESPYFDVSTVGRRRLLKLWVDTHERYLKLLLLLGNCTLAVWHIYPLVDELDYNLVVGIRLPFRFETPVRYATSYLVVSIAFHYVSIFVMVTDLIMQAHMVPLICQLVILSDCFVNIIEDCKEEIDCRDLAKNKEFAARYLRRLGNYVEQHKLILTHTMDLRAILSGPLLGQLGASGILICFIGYQVTMSIVGNISKCLMSLLYLSYNMFGLYIVCRWCEEITIQSYNIGRAVYSSKWETGLSVLPGVRSSILLIIARASKPLVFTAGGMYDLSLKAYTNLVKTSYSALTVVLRFRSE